MKPSEMIRSIILGLLAISLLTMPLQACRKEALVGISFPHAPTR